MKRRARIRRRRRREQQDSKTWVAPEIPPDLLIEFLLRLPAESVMRFKCVSKFLSSLFSSTYFCNRFLMHPSPRQPPLYMSLFDRCHYSKSILLSSVPTPTTCEFHQNLTIPKMGGYPMRILRGFICFKVYKNAHIYNPGTRQLVFIPAIKSDIIAQESRCDIFYFIGHDPVNHQYKLLCTVTSISQDMRMIRSEHWLFVLEPGGFWKRVANKFQPHLPSYLELIIKGVLYYLAYTDLRTCVLVSFDMRSEEFNMIQVPRKAGDMLTRADKRQFQIEYGGKAAVFDMTAFKDSGTVDIWIVEDWRKKEWSMKTLVVKPSQMHLVIGNSFMPKGTTPKGQVVLAPVKLIYPYYFLYYDLHINDLQKVEIKGIPQHWFSKSETSFDMRFMDTSEGIET